MNPFLKKYWKICFWLIPLLFIVPSPAAAIPEDAILAVVNNEVITYRDLSEYMKSRYLQLKLEGVPESDIKAMMSDLETNGIRRLIQDKLIINEANRKQVQVRKEVLDERIRQIKNKYPSEDAFIAALAQDGLNISDLRKKIEDQIKVQELIESEVKEKIIINPQTITDYYTNNLAQFQKPERINLDSIFIPKSEDAAAAKAKAKKSLDLIRSGQDFRKIAQEYSASPAIGTVEKGKMLPQIETAVWNIPLDQMSNIIEVDNGFYIFKVLGKTPAMTAPLEDVKGSIQQIVFNEIFIQRLEAWIDELEKNTFVEIKTEEPK